MKKIFIFIFIFIFFLFGVFFSFAQSEIRNCIILIDGKLPYNDGRTSGFVEYNSEFNQKDTVAFFCYLPTIRFESTDFEKLRSIPDTTIITIHVKFQEYQKCTRKRYHYTSSFPLRGLLNDRCIVFSITNFNKKKGTYYFDYEAFGDGGCLLRKPWQKGYNKKIEIFHDTRPCKPKKKR
jgi:hypothetical protein